MTEEHLTAGYRNNDTAPFVYFDHAVTFGIARNGVLMIELGARTLSPMKNSTLVSEFLCTGRLRCSVEAARSLQEAIAKALALHEAPRTQKPEISN